MRVNDHGDPMLEIHKRGADRHRAVWIDANQAAIAAASELDVDYTNAETKKLLSLVTLFVLDASHPPRVKERK